MRRFSATESRGKIPRPCGTMRTPRRDTRCAVIPVTSAPSMRTWPCAIGVKPDQTARQRRLAHSVASEQCDDLAHVDRQRYTLNDRRRPVAEMNVLDGE